MVLQACNPSIWKTQVILSYTMRFYVKVKIEKELLLLIIKLTIIKIVINAFLKTRHFDSLSEMIGCVG